MRARFRIIEWGTALGNNKDTQIVRIEHTGQPRQSEAKAGAAP